MPDRRAFLTAGLAVLVLEPELAGAQQGAASQTILDRLREGNHVLLMRHALAPGTGDPENFRVDDCSTQRNLNDAGRADAKRIGQTLRREAIPISRIYASRWCRALETAHLMNLGSVAVMPDALDSFFAQRGEQKPSTAALRKLIENQPRDGTNTIMISHQVNITAISGLHTSPSDIIVIPAGVRFGFADIVGRLRL